MENLIKLQRYLVKQADDWDKLTPKSIQTLIMAGLGGLGGAALGGPLGGITGLIGGAYMGTQLDSKRSPITNKEPAKMYKELTGVKETTPEDRLDTAKTYLENPQNTAALKEQIYKNVKEPESGILEGIANVTRGFLGFLPEDSYGMNSYQKLHRLTPEGLEKVDTDWVNNAKALVTSGAYAYKPLLAMGGSYLFPDISSTFFPQPTTDASKIEATTQAGVIGGMALKDTLTNPGTTFGSAVKGRMGGGGFSIPYALYLTNKAYQGIYPEGVRTSVNDFNEGMENRCIRTILDEDYKNRTEPDYRAALDTVYTSNLNPEEYINTHKDQFGIIKKYNPNMSYEGIASTLALRNIGTRNSEGYLTEPAYLDLRDQSIDNNPGNSTLAGPIKGLAKWYLNDPKLDAYNNKYKIKDTNLQNLLQRKLDQEHYLWKAKSDYMPQLVAGKWQDAPRRAWDLLSTGIKIAPTILSNYQPPTSSPFLSPSKLDYKMNSKNYEEFNY